MKHEVISKIQNDIENYRQAGREVLNEVREASTFKPIAAGMGVYEQRTKKTFMTRVRIPAGVLTAVQLQKIYEIAKELQLEGIHFTTRQAIQLHALPFEATAHVMEKIMEVELYTKGGGGNNPRNVACSPLSGVDPKEAFDVTPYALAATDLIMDRIYSYDLPRKYKVAFASDSEDIGNSTIADLGFFAFVEDGKPYFRVYGGGGLGRNAAKAIILEEKIETSEILYYVQAMKELFEAEGDRTNRNKARIRYIVTRLGEEGFKARFLEALKIVKDRENLHFKIKEEKQEKPGIVTDLKHPRLFAQKQQGLYSVYIHPTAGQLSLDKLEKIVTLLDQTKQPEIRLSTTQGFYVRNLDGKEAEKWIQETEGIGGNYSIVQSTSCTGASTCQLGLTQSQKLLQQILNQFTEAGQTILEALPRIYISGCLNSCGAHQIGAIGFSGKVKRVGDVVKDFYTLFLGGVRGDKTTTLGTAYGDIDAEKIPEFLYRLAELKQNALEVDFIDWIQNEKEKIEALISEYTV